MSAERREWMELVAQLRAEIERLQLENNQLHTECGHREADCGELRAKFIAACLKAARAAGGGE